MKFFVIAPFFALACQPDTFTGEELSLQDIYVIDGDSVRVDGENIRLVGFDTPETFQPKCEEERALGYEAKENLRTELNEADDIHLVLETKQNGEPKRGKYGRLLGSLYVDGEDVADLQIDAGLARPYDGGKRGSWCN